METNDRVVQLTLKQQWPELVAGHEDPAIWATRFLVFTGARMFGGQPWSGDLPDKQEPASAEDAPGAVPG